MLMGLGMTLLFIPLSIQASLSGEAITQYTGNAAIKQYGESLENGTSPQVTTADTPTSTTGTTYYVDARNGKDTNNGTSDTTPWQSLNKVNQTTFKPGDRILLKAGSEFSKATIHPKGSGSADHPIYISSYGTGAMPKISGQGTVSDSVYFYNQQYIDLSNLNISNTVTGYDGKENDANFKLLKDIRGVHVVGQDAGTLNGYTFHNLYVHDAAGTVLGVSGAGWDASKRTGGIVFEIAQPKSKQPTKFNNITIKDNVINNNSYGGIIIKQWQGDKTGTNEKWASRDGAKAPSYQTSSWQPHTNVLIRENYLSQAASDYANDTIYVTSTKDAVVEDNFSNKAGLSGIELYYTDNVLVQNNEIYGTVAKSGADSNGIDPDKETTNALIQYNYIHDTGDGFLLCGLVFGTATFRYNVVQNASKNYINPHGTAGQNYLYNNVFYNSKSRATVSFLTSSGGSALTNNAKNKHNMLNNLFLNTATGTTASKFAEGKGTAYSHNAYYGPGVTAPTQDANAVTQKPLLKGDLGSGSDLAALQLTTKSPLLGAGTEIQSSAELGITWVFSNTDFFGHAINPQTPNIGIDQGGGS